MLVARGINADTTVSELERLVARRGAPEHLRMDNGPEMTADALKDWCRFSHTGTAYIEPGSPWQNPFVESFHSRVRDELLDVEEFSCLAEARMVIADWQEDHNRRRPHSSLGMKAPAVFAAEWTRAARRPSPREEQPGGVPSRLRPNDTRADRRGRGHLAADDLFLLREQGGHPLCEEPAFIERAKELLESRPAGATTVDALREFIASFPAADEQALLRKKVVAAHPELRIKMRAHLAELGARARGIDRRRPRCRPRGCPPSPDRGVLDGTRSTRGRGRRARPRARDGGHRSGPRVPPGRPPRTPARVALRGRGTHLAMNPPDTSGSA
jgi:hypothetical protein